MTESGGRRIQAVDPALLDVHQQEVFNRIAGSRGRVRGPFTVLLHVAPLADRIQALGAYLRYEAQLDRDLAELAVLVTARSWSCAFEWETHEPLARAAGVPSAVIKEVGRLGDSNGMPERFRDVCEFARELASAGRVSDETYGAVSTRLGTERTVELTALVGYYTLLAMTLNAHDM